MTFEEAWNTAGVEICQDRKELEVLFNLVRNLDCRSFLEIGSMHGGTFWCLSHALPIGSEVFSIDFNPVTGIAERLNAKGYKAKAIGGNSQDREVIEQVQKCDFVFIDGDHSYKGAKQDYQNYKANKIVAFHDIRSSSHRPVGEFWRELRDSFSQEQRYLEIKLAREKMGIGAMIL